MLNEKVIGDYAYQLSEQHKVGTGQFSHVYKGYHLKTQKQVAIKQIDKKQVKGIFEQMVRNEINILRQLNHQFILKMYDYYETVNNIYIVTEFCETDILQILKQQGSIPEDQVIIYVLQIAEALQYLRQLKIVHRDVKPSNILLHKGQVRLADFGFAIPQNLVDHEERKFQIGSPLYMSPETLIRNEYNHRTDLWALGVLYYEMIFGVVPFFSMELSDLVQKLKQYKQDYTLLFKHPISEGSTEAIRNLLAYEPTHRCDLTQLAIILQNYLRSRLHATSSGHSQSLNKKRVPTPDASPQAKTRLLNNKKQLVSCSGIHSDKKTTYFQKKQEKSPVDNGYNSQPSKREEDQGTDRKDGLVNGQNDVSYVREHNFPKNGVLDVSAMGNEEFLQYFIQLLEQQRGNVENRDEKINECQYILYQYYGKDQQVLNNLKSKRKSQ